MKYAYIEQQRRAFPVSAMCRALSVSRSGYYDWCGRPESMRQKEDKQLLHHLRQIHQQSRSNYGIVKAWKVLKQSGIDCGRDRVARLRRTHEIYAKRLWKRGQIYFILPLEGLKFVCAGF